MKAYKRELSHFFSNKKEEDEKLKRALSNKSFAEKKEIIEQYRETAKLEQGVYSIGEHHFERKRFVRDTTHLDNLKEDLANTYLEFNKYKYDALYELIEVNEAKFDQFETDIAQLKEQRDKMIRKKAEKLDESNHFNDKIDLNLRQLVDAFRLAEKEDRKEIYREIILLKKMRFDRLEPRLSMIRRDKLNTLVTDYVPIRGNEKKILAFNVDEEVDLTTEVLEPEEGVEIEADNSNNSSRNTSNEE